MDEKYLTLQQHEEYAKRVDAEDERQNRRIASLEESVKEIHSLTVSVERMAVNMENMLSEQKKQGERLEKLEREPAEIHRQIKMAAITALISVIVGAVAGAAFALM